MTVTAGGAATSDAEREPEGEPDDRPEKLHRVVVPVSNPRNAPLLVSIARAMLDPEAGELLALAVATDEAQAESTSESVAQISDALDASFGPDHGIEVRRRHAPAIARGILDFVRENNPDLVVMGMDLSADGRHFSVVSDAVIEAVHCPVLAIRPSDMIGVERVLVGVDGSAESLAALRLAVLAADGLHLPLRAIHVRDPALSRSFAAAVIAEAAYEVPEWMDADGHVVEAPHPTQGLVEESHPTDLLFLASARRRGIARFTSGGTLDQTLRHEDAHIAVLARRQNSTRTRRTRFWSWFRALRPTLTRLERESVGWRAGANAPLTSDYLILLGVASVLASFGLLQDNVAVVIGAMLVAPLLGPLAAASTGLASARVDVLGRSLFTLLAGTVGAVVLALGVGALIPVDRPTDEMLARGSPSLIDLGIAIFAGIVGAYATARKDIPAALAGVAIAAALVPPICTTGLALGLGDTELAAGSLLLFTVNTVSVVVVGSIVLWWMGLRPTDGHRRPASWFAAVLGTVLAFVLVVAGLDAFAEARRASVAADDLERLFPDDEIIDFDVDDQDPIVVTAVIRTTGTIEPDDVRAAARSLGDELGHDVVLRVVEERVVTSD
ncbi:TIGR00341 family protein [Actinospongicola halichondriae]|uniref:TIGR00341 family protein n=1 Tax=Actinospongicola halichondriae TaxID=3236844 RepID=UPI003D547323